MVQGSFAQFLNMENNQQVQKNQPNTLQTFFESEGVKTKFQAVLKERTPQFLTSLFQVVNGNDTLKAANPISIFNAAMIAATLDLPINQNLGFAWIVPYKGQAQFQLGYKGFIQLAQRSGQYARITTAPVYENQFKGWNSITEDLQVDGSIKGQGLIHGYFAFFRLLNGYEKVAYWTRQQVLDHAKRFSKAWDSQNSIWKTDFDKMAMKTVLKSLLSTWGPLSIQMETAIKVDQAVINDAEGNSVTYSDNEGPSREEIGAKANDATEQALKGLTSEAKNQGGK